MSKKKEEFSDQLLDQEIPNPEYRAEYDRAVRSMYEKRISVLGRLVMLGLAALGLGFALLFYLCTEIVYRMSAAGAPIGGKAGFVFAAVLGLTWFGLAMWVAVAGKINLKVHPKLAAGIAGVLIVLLLILFILTLDRLSPADIGVQVDALKGFMVLVAFLITLILALILLLSGRVLRAELNTCRKLLELEYRLADLAEAVQKKQR